METKTFWIPTRPYSLIDAINRSAAATGSIQYAARAEFGDYNGHQVNVAFNDYRQYWVCEYFWAGRIVLSRGSLDSALRAARAEFDRGARGSTVRVFVSTDADAEIVKAAGFEPWSEEIELAHGKTFTDARWAKLHEAFMWERHGMAPAVGFLANSKTVEEYTAKVEAFFAAHKSRRAEVGA